MEVAHIIYYNENGQLELINDARQGKKTNFLEMNSKKNKLFLTSSVIAIVLK